MQPVQLKLQEAVVAAISRCSNSMSLGTAPCSSTLFITHAEYCNLPSQMLCSIAFKMMLTKQQACVGPTRGLCQSARPLLPASFRTRVSTQISHRVKPNPTTRTQAQTYGRDLSTAPRLIQHKNEAFWYGDRVQHHRYGFICWRSDRDPAAFVRRFYRFLSIVYDSIVNPGHWTEEMREDALSVAQLNSPDLKVRAMQECIVLRRARMTCDGRMD